MIVRRVTLALALLTAGSLGCDDPPEPDRVVVDNIDRASDRPDETKTTAGSEGAEKTDRAKADGSLHPPTDEQVLALDAAKADFLAGNLGGAERGFEKVIATGPLSPQKVSAYIALGQIYRETDRPTKALELYRELAEKAPKTPEAHYMLARALAETGESTKTIKRYERTLHLQPDYLQAYVELGGMYEKAGRTEDAQNIFFKYEKKVYELAGKLEADETEVEEKLHILDVFSFVDDDRASEAILKALTDPRPKGRERAIYLAADFQLGEAVPILERLAEEDPSRAGRLAAREALTLLEGAPADNVPKVERN